MNPELLLLLLLPFFLPFVQNQVLNTTADLLLEVEDEDEAVGIF